MKCLQQKTRANQEHYKEKRKEPNKVCKQKINYGITKLCMQMKLITELK